MREFLVCDMCTATVSTDSALCDFCGNDFKNIGSSGEILRLKDEIEKKIYTSDFPELLQKINKTKYKDHPIIIYRKAKALLLEYMTNDGIIDSEEFIEVINMINNIANISEDYWTEFVLYLTVLFPTSHTKLLICDFKNILAFLKSINRDLDQVIYSRMIQQIIISSVGDTFLKEYNYYLDERNFINNKDFISKKQHLKERYESLTKDILNQINK